LCFCVCVLVLCVFVCVCVFVFVCVCAGARHGLAHPGENCIVSFQITNTPVAKEGQEPTLSL
jgi:hypothetical protein